MQMQKIKKVASGALGLFLTGATLFSPALAADLSDFQDMAPANTLIVVGANAATADVVGGINIGGKLAQSGIESASCSVSCEDGGVSTVSNGVKIETSSKKLYLGYSTSREYNLAAVKNTLSANDFSLLEKQTIEYDDGTTTTMNQYIDLTSNTKVVYNEADPEGEVDTPRLILYNADGSNMYNMTLTFPTGLDTTAEASNGPGIASETITIMGKSFTFGTDSELSNTSLVLYGGGEEQTLVAGGDAITFELDGETHTIRMTSWTGSGTATDPLKGVFELDGKTYTKGDSSTITINAEANSEITIKEVKETKVPSAAGGAATEGASADIFIGSAKLTLTNGQEVEKGDDEIDGAVVYITASAAKINEIKIEYKPDEDVTAEAGVPYRDPVFGAFEFVMTGLTPAIDSSARDEIAITKNGQKVKLSVPTKDGNTLAVNVYEATATTTFALGIDGKDLFVNATPINVDKNDYVLVSDGEYSNILQFKSISDSDNLITLRDVASGDDIEVAYGSSSLAGTMYIGSASYAITNVDETNDQFDLVSWAGSGTAPSVIPIVSRNGAVVTLMNGTSGSYATTFSGAAYFNISEEDTIEDESSAEATDFIVSFATKSDSDDIDTVTIVAGTPTDFLSISDGDVSAGLSKYGSLIKKDTDSDYFKMYYPDEQAYANVYVMKAGVDAPTAGAAAGTSVSQTVTVDVPSLGSGISKLDSEITAADQETKNLILVGGPNANNLVKDLAADGKTPDVAYWQANLQGGYILQTVEDAFATGKTAIVVAGWEADETREASLKLATEELSGAAISCTGSSCADLVYPAEEEAAAEEEEVVE